MTIEELRSQRKAMEEERKKLDAQIEALKLAEVAQKDAAVVAKIDAIPNSAKEIILSQMKHECASCVEGRTENGWSSTLGRYRCRKCMLTEILSGEHGGTFDFNITADIFTNSP